MAGSSLGECRECHHSLCVRGQMVACMICGKEYPEHSLSVEMATAKAAEKNTPQNNQVCRSEDYVRANDDPRLSKFLANMIEAQQSLARLEITCRQQDQKTRALELLVRDLTVMQEQRVKSLELLVLDTAMAQEKALTQAGERIRVLEEMVFSAPDDMDSLLAPAMTDPVGSPDNAPADPAAPSTEPAPGPEPRRGRGRPRKPRHPASEPEPESEPASEPAPEMEPEGVLA